MRNKIFLLLAIILPSLLRLLLDKVLAIHEGALSVAYWGQLQSIADLIASVALVGVGQGLTVLAARMTDHDIRPMLMRKAWKWSLILSGVMLLVVLMLFSLSLVKIGDGAIPTSWLVMAAMMGFLYVPAGLQMAWWLGISARGRVVSLLLALGLPPVVVVWVASSQLVLAALLATLCTTGLLALMLRRAVMQPIADVLHERKRTETKSALASLKEFIPIGIAIGILTPLSVLTIRVVVGGELSWREVGYLQAIWRTSDPIVLLAAGAFNVWMLPRLSRLAHTPEFNQQLFRYGVRIALPAAFGLLCLWFSREFIFALFYAPDFAVPAYTYGWFMLGDVLRVTSWIFLFGLFARGQARAVVITEFLSQPLFALLVWIYADGLTLNLVGQLYACSYLVYSSGTALAVLKRSRQKQL
jgi:PST family polysaccharide transporter